MADDFKKEAVAVNQSYVGNVTNPIVEARLKMAMSANALAKRLGLSRQYLSRAEQGTYSSLNPALLKWTANASEFEPRAVVKRYEQFQRTQRRQSADRIHAHKLERHGSLSPGGVIFERWRSGYFNSPTAFAIAFCVHPDLVQKYEEGITKTMPKQIKAALLEVGLIESNWVDEPSEADATDARVSV